MSKIMEEFAIEERTEAKLEAARNMLLEGVPMEKIACRQGLSIETIQQLAEEVKVPAEHE